jgi:hypothetical protein
MKESRLNDLIQLRRQWKELIAELLSLVYRHSESDCDRSANLEDVIYPKLKSWLQNNSNHFDDYNDRVSADRLDVFLSGCLKLVSYSMDDECPERLIGKRSSNSETDDCLEKSLASIVSSIFTHRTQLLDETLTRIINFYQNPNVGWVESLLLSYFLLLKHLTKFALLQETAEDWLLFICSAFEKMKCLIVDSGDGSIVLTHCTYRIIFDTFLQLLSLPSSSQESLITQTYNRVINLFSLFFDFLDRFKLSSNHFNSSSMKAEDESVYFLTGNYSSVNRLLAEFQFRVIQWICGLLTWIDSCNKVLLERNGEEDQELATSCRKELLELLFLCENNNFSSSGRSFNNTTILSFQDLLLCLSDNDKELVDFLNIFLEMEKRLSTISEESELNLWKSTFLSRLKGLRYESEYFFLFLISSIFHYDKQVIIDLLTSNETIFLRYFLQFLKFSSMKKLEKAAEKLNSFIKNNNHASAKVVLTLAKKRPSGSGKYFIFFDETVVDEKSALSEKAFFPSQEMFLLDDNTEDGNDQSLSDWSSFCSNINNVELKELLNDVAVELEKLYRLNLVSFNPSALCKRIDLFLSV